MADPSSLTLPPVQPVIITPSAPASTWTFTQGLILGQASFILLCLIFIRYVVFSPAEEIDGEDWKKRREERVKKAVLSTTSVPAPLPSVLLNKTGYEMATHPAESTDWINVLFAQILQGYRNDLLSHGGEEGARQRIEKWMNPEQGALSWLDPIRITALSLGTAFPLLSNARIRPADGQGHIRAEIDIDYADTLSLSLATSVLINFPRPRFAVLPVSLGVELVSIGGTLSVQILDAVEGKQQLHVCLLPDFHLNLKTTTLLGSRAKLQDVPKLEQLILTRLRGIVQDRIVHPNHLTLSLPQLESQSTSKPIITDLGERTVNAMKEGISKAAADFVHIEPDDLPQAGHHLPPTPPSPPASPPLPGSEQPIRGLGQKKITMPAGFPSFSNSATPMQTPGAGNSRSPLPMVNTQIQASSARPTASTSASSYRPSSLYATSTSAMPSPAIQGSQRPMSMQLDGHASAGAADPIGRPDSQFRFRGQFASQPGTPRPGYSSNGGMAVNGMNGSNQGFPGDQRRVGALNAKS